MYTDSREHILDEINKLELLIHLNVLKQQQIRAADPLEQYRGLVLSEEEIAGLIEGETGLSKEDEMYKLREMKIRDVSESLSIMTQRIRERCEDSLNNGIYLSMNRLAEIFSLSDFEKQCIIICLAVEMDQKYGKLYAYLQDDVTLQKPCAELILKLLCHEPQERIFARACFLPQASLMKYKILKVIDNAESDSIPLISRGLKLDDRIVDFLLEFEEIDKRIASAVQVILPGSEVNLNFTKPENLQKMQKFIYSYFRELSSDENDVVFYLYGKYGAGKKLMVKSLSNEFNLPLILCDVKKMLDSPIPFEEMMQILGRETVLQGAILCMENFNQIIDLDDKNQLKIESLFEAIKTFSRLTFLFGQQPWNPQEMMKDYIFIDLEVPTPDVSARQNLWEELSKEYLDVDTAVYHLVWQDLAAKFRFTPGQIRDALMSAQQRAIWKSSGESIIAAEDLYTACREQLNLRLGRLAQKLNPIYTWKDIILPPDQQKQLKEICCQVKYREAVYDKWGFSQKLSYGRGLNVLFSGPPGTGKTMAAEVIANELRMDIYKIDLSQIVSKYVGETEKNLQRIFDEAATSNTILFFDEADALFGRRSEVRDAHDRYANVETAYLLQKMEEYDGITILATNLRKNMDDAFVRRLRFIIEFPLPDEEHREKIWQNMFPEDTPRSEELDMDFLAKKIKISGGSIRNIVLAAAFLAVGEEVGIGMKHLIRATRDEMEKSGKLCLKEDFGDYYEFIR